MIQADRQGWIGAYRVGYWHSDAEAVPLVWEDLVEGDPIAAAPLKIQPYEAAVLCFLGDTAAEQFLPTVDQVRAPVHPIAAPWAAISLRQMKYRFRGTMDFGHDVAWRRPWPAGEEARLSAHVEVVREVKGRRELVIRTRCADLAGATIFDVRQTTVVPQPRVSGDKAPRSVAPARPYDPGQVLYERPITCTLEWSRRPYFPRHPNFHTDIEEARAAGFETVVLTGLQVATHVLEGVHDFLGPTAFHRARTRYRFIRAVPAEGKVRLVISKDDDGGSGQLRLAVLGADNAPFTLGSVTRDALAYD